MAKPAPTIINDGYAMVPIASVQPHPANPNKGNRELLRDSVGTNGFYGALIVQRSTGYILAGSHRHADMLTEGAAEVPVIWVDVDDVTARKIMAADNAITRAGGYDRDKLAALLTEFGPAPGGYRGSGFTAEEATRLLAAYNGRPDAIGLAERFGVPPFSVLRTTDGWWQARKQMWLQLGIQSELGRDGEANPPHAHTVNQNPDGSLNFTTGRQAGRQA